MEEMLMQFVGSTFFPAVMCVYLTYYMQTTQKEMRSSIEELKNAITILTERLKNDT